MKLICGLDIGSFKVSAVIAELRADGSLNVLGGGLVPSRGLSRGAIVDIGGVTGVVSRAIDDAMRAAEIKAKPYPFIVNITSPAIEWRISKGIVPISSRGGEIQKHHIAKAMSVARTIPLALDREIIHELVRYFVVDDQHKVKDPIGLYAVKLELEEFVITAPRTQIQNITKCINGAGFEVEGVAFSVIAAALSFLTREQREEGVILANIGHLITEIVVFKEDAPIYMGAIPIGGSGKKEANDLQDLVLDFKERSRDMNFLKEIRSIVLTGGTSLIQGCPEFFNSQFGIPVRRLQNIPIEGDSKIVNNALYATSLALISYAAEERKRHKAAKESGGNFLTRSLQTVGDLLDEYF